MVSHHKNDALVFDRDFGESAREAGCWFSPLVKCLQVSFRQMEEVSGDVMLLKAGGIYFT